METINITFKRFKYGIQINFGQNNTFLSCNKGTDLNDFDQMLEYILPNIDLEKISAFKARNLEKRLYRALLPHKQNRTMIKAFFDFINYIKSKYTKEKRYTKIILKKEIIGLAS